MTIRNAAPKAGAASATGPDDGPDRTEARLLEAATEIVATRGTRGLSIAELARAAGVSRPTVYRRWESADDVLRALIAHRMQLVITAVGPGADDRAAIVDRVVRFGELFHADAVFSRLLGTEPEVFTRYAFQRIGRSQRVILEWLAANITAAQEGGTVRPGSATDMAVMVLLLTQSAVFSHKTVTTVISADALRAELAHAIDGYLRP
ncbi:TetR/AcrR family transcriptional regulator [Promicromonospora iranensis]|uniref:AcrR family transcriptional regulator n=1 Tax=Promicromonospora iranensis TaxID=1105144 RepID=A0ABU2CT75_9MICO|nr:TetR/AcrR family transcriptional regulator [Promicromonospora iranensis]MDR7384545.1 AcrR family transcriptional regulator [Promicromonospora iranensis]